MRQGHDDSWSRSAELDSLPEVKTPAYRCGCAHCGLPVLANADFGHTSPILTFPVGGEAEVTVGESSSLRITRH
jgi:muramoyltetrapeptide carboxypeptidase LdcA involved in peptidoglycan recycling